MEKIQKVLRFATLLIIAWYLFLCLSHYFTQRPMWNDEECVFLSIKNFTPQQIFNKVLMADQVFPRFYLFVIQSISAANQYNLFSLRILPFIFMICAFLVWLKIASYELKDRLTYLTFVLSWAGSVPLVYYSAELKQYSMDVFSASLFILFFYHQQRLAQDEQSKGKYLLIVFLFPLLTLFSYPAFLLCGITGWNLLKLSQKDKRQISALIIFSVSLVACLVFSYLFDMRLRPIHAVTKGFGDYFISFNSIGDFFKTFGEGTRNLIVRWFAEQPKLIKKIAMPFAILGFINLFITFFRYIKKDGFIIKSVNTAGVALYFGLFILGALKKYPFIVPRTALFFSPLLLVFIAKTMALPVGWAKSQSLAIRALSFIPQTLYILLLGTISFFIAKIIFTTLYLGAQAKLW